MFAVMSMHACMFTLMCVMSVLLELPLGSNWHICQEKNFFRAHKPAREPMHFNFWPIENVSNNIFSYLWSQLDQASFYPSDYRFLSRVGHNHCLQIHAGGLHRGGHGPGHPE